MRLSNERKLFAGVLALALAALGVDRFILGGAGGPAAASAAEYEAPAAAVDASASADLASAPESARPRAAAAVSSPAFPVAKQFAALSTLAANQSDGFAPPARWREAMEQVRREAAKAGAEAAHPAPTPAQDDAAGRWASERKFTAIIRARDGGTDAAVIDDRAVRVGEMHRGLTLVAISLGDGAADPGSATFEDSTGSVRVQLRLPTTENSR